MCLTPPIFPRVQRCEDGDGLDAAGDVVVTVRIRPFN